MSSPGAGPMVTDNEVGRAVVLFRNRPSYGCAETKHSRGYTSKEADECSASGPRFIPLKRETLG